MRLCIMRCLFSLCFVLAATGFSLFDLQNSYVQFERLLGKADGRIGVSFRCKTYMNAGLLFYVDDQTQGSGEYLTLYLRDGFLVLELSDQSGETHTARSKVVINDLQWHKIEVELSPHHAVFILDNATQTDFNITAGKMQLQSDVFVGGFPHDINIMSLSHDTMMFEQRFLGCVEDLRWFSYASENSTESRAPKVVKSSGMDLKCKDACKPRNPCSNDGVCINKFAMAECSCSETGYRGATCEKESPVVGISSADHRVVFEISSSFIVINSETTSMFVRFRTSQSDGVFFYTTHKGDYILLELTNGRVAASVNLGSGSVAIATKKDGYNDNQWHRVKLVRVKRLVNLTVDNSDTSEGETRGTFDKFHLPNKKTSFILGGLPADEKPKLKSVSRKNFTGCLQELIFNGYDLFLKFNRSAKEVTSRGKILKTCPEVSTERPQVVTTTKIAASVSASDAFSGNSSYPTTDQKLPCIFAGVPCKPATTGTPTSQAHVVTTAQQTSTDSLSSTTDERFSITFKALSTIEPMTSKTTSETSKTTPDTSKSTSDTSKTTPDTSKATPDSPTSLKPSNNGHISHDNGEARTTGEVIMAKRNERGEEDLTVWFIIAAVVGLVAFLLAILIIVKVNSTSRKKYAVKGQKYGQKDYWTDTGSFQRSTKPLV